MFRWGFLGLFPILLEFSAFALFFDFDEEFLSVRAYLGSVSSSYERLDFFPIFPEELQTYGHSGNTLHKLLVLLLSPSAVELGIFNPFAGHCSKEFEFNYEI
jgi:hypothetical protein